MMGYPEEERLGLLAFFVESERRIEKQNMKIARVVMRFVRLGPMNFNKGEFGVVRPEG